MTVYNGCDCFCYRHKQNIIIITKVLYDDSYSLTFAIKFCFKVTDFILIFSKENFNDLLFIPCTSLQKSCTTQILRANLWIPEHSKKLDDSL